jgi:hypothetical protein
VFLSGNKSAAGARSSGRVYSFSNRLEIGRFGAAGIRLDVERHFLAFREAPHSSRFNGRDMDEYVLAAALWRDESETLCGVEKLHCTDGHLLFLEHRNSTGATCDGGRGKREHQSLRSVRSSGARKAGQQQQKRFV